MNLKCKNCGSYEFISKPNRYDVFKSDGKKIQFQRSELINEKLDLYCRNCSEKIEINKNYVKYS